MSTTEEPEVTTEVLDAASELLPTGKVVHADEPVEELLEGGLTTEAAADLLPTGDAAVDETPAEPESSSADLEVLDEVPLLPTGKPDRAGLRERAGVRR